MPTSPLLQGWTDCHCLSPVSPGHLRRLSTSDLQLGVGGRKLDTAICCPGLEGHPGVVDLRNLNQRGWEAEGHSCTVALPEPEFGTTPPCFSRFNCGPQHRVGLRNWVWLLVPNPFTHQSASLLFWAMPIAMFTCLHDLMCNRVGLGRGGTEWEQTWEADCLFASGPEEPKYCAILEGLWTTGETRAWGRRGHNHQQ